MPAATKCCCAPKGPREIRVSARTLKHTLCLQDTNHEKTANAMVYPSLRTLKRDGRKAPPLQGARPPRMKTKKLLGETIAVDEKERQQGCRTPKTRRGENPVETNRRCGSCRNYSCRFIDHVVYVHLVKAQPAGKAGGGCVFSILLAGSQYPPLRRTHAGRPIRRLGRAGALCACESNAARAGSRGRGFRLPEEIRGGARQLPRGRGQASPPVWRDWHRGRGLSQDFGTAEGHSRARTRARLLLLLTAESRRGLACIDHVVPRAPRGGATPTATWSRLVWSVTRKKGERPGREEFVRSLYRERSPDRGPSSRIASCPWMPLAGRQASADDSEWGTTQEVRISRCGKRKAFDGAGAEPAGGVAWTLIVGLSISTQFICTSPEATSKPGLGSPFRNFVMMPFAIPFRFTPPWRPRSIPTSVI